MAPRTIPVSVIVLTHDEAANIEPCLESLGAFDELVVVDSGSSDGTTEIVRHRFPDARVLHNPFEDFGQQRNWALQHATPRNPWVLFFDADERCTPECAKAIAAAVEKPGGHDGFFLCYRNFFLGRWIRHCTLFPTWQLRLLRVGKVRYRKEGHGQREVMNGRAGYIQEPYDHFGFSKGIHNWIARHNEYSTNEVELIRAMADANANASEVFTRDPVRRRRALKRLASRVPLRPAARFFYLYVLRRGFLDGRAGLIFCLLRAAQEAHIVAKLAEVEQRIPAPVPTIECSGDSTIAPLKSSS
jgi:glycosyltransferase involved in cell wall biosynthesis